MWFDLFSFIPFPHLRYRIYHAGSLALGVSFGSAFLSSGLSYGVLVLKVYHWQIGDESWQTCGNPESPPPPKNLFTHLTIRKAWSEVIFPKRTSNQPKFSSKSLLDFRPHVGLQSDCPISACLLSFQSFLRFPPRSAGLIVLCQCQDFFSHTRLFFRKR